MTTTTFQPNEIIKELNNILFRFALIDTETSFEKFLESYLDVIIEKLNYNDELVKKKVMEVLSNINKRSMVTSNIQFPIDKLLSLYHNEEKSMMVKNFAIIYIEKGFKTLSPTSKVPFLSQITKDINKLQSLHQDIFCHIILSILISVQIPKNEKEKNELFEFLRNEKESKIILSFFFDFLITPPPEAQSKAIVGGIPPCHSSVSLQRIMGKQLNKYDFNQLNERKLAILNVLSSGVIQQENDIFLHFLVASVDSNFQEVQKKAEDFIKRLSKVKFENSELIEQMYSIFLGSQAIASKKQSQQQQQQQQTQPEIPLDQRRQEASPILKERILQYFCKSIVAANQFSLTLHVIFDSIYGSSTTMKLKQSAMIFVQWVFRHSSDQQLSTMGPVIFSGLLKLIDELENSGSTSKEVNELKSFTYMSLGLLCKRNKDLFKNDIQLIGKLMRKVTTEESMVAISIQDSLVMMREAFIEPSKEIGDQLISILNSFVHGYENSEYQIRTICLQWAQHCFPFQDIRSRYISLIFSGDSRPDIREEAKRGLEPYQHQGNMMIPPTIEESKQIYPDFKSLLNYIIDRREELIKSNTGSGGGGKSKYFQGGLQIGFSAMSYENMLELLRKCLRKSALLNGQTTSQYVMDSLDKDSIEKYLSFIEIGLQSKIGDEVALVSSTSLLDLMNLDEQVIEQFAQSPAKLGLIEKLIQSSKPLFKDLYSKMIGLISFYFNKEKLDELINQFMKKVEFDNDVIEVYGSMLSLASMISNFNRKQQSEKINQESVVKKFINLIFERFIDHNNQAIKLCTVQSIGLVGVYKSLPFSTLDEKLKIISKLIQLVKSTASSERNLAEGSIQALGWICFGDSDNDSKEFKEKVVDSLFELVNNKNEEMQFTIGETLSLIIGGHKMKQSIFPFSPFSTEEILSEKRKEIEFLGSQSNMLIDDDNNNNSGNDDDGGDDESKNIIKTFDRILTNYFSDRQSPITRCSAGIWMVCLLKNFGKLPFVQPQLPLIQNGFISLLSDNNELTQDVASKGITLVYDSSIDPKFKEFLVSNLGKTLSGKPTQKAPGSTELLPEGTINGGNKTGSALTYKELTSVANDLGKPDMVYKLMNLSTHHQIWNSKKGASFAIVSLASKAKDELAPLLPSLIPKIYRFVYDPNPKMAASMKSILNALIDQKDLFPQYFQPILKEVLQGMGTTAWRVREASCSAIPDTIQNATPEQILPYLEEIFFMSFRTLDDIKESVRKAAEVSMKSIGNVSARLCDPAYTSPSKAKEVLKLILPFILNKGISNDSNEVKQFSIKQLVRISKSSKQLLTPYIPDMITVLLESLSSLEPASFNYASFHAESMNVSQEQLESMRVEISKTSPLNDILEVCQRYIDDSNITQVLANLNQLVQFSVGIITRVGVAKFIGALFQSKTAPINDLPEQSLTKLINTMFPSVIDKSPTIRKHFIVALSHILSKSPTKLMGQLLDRISSLVSADSDPLQLEDNLIIVGTIYKELFKNCPSKISNFNVDVIPFLYFYKSHPKKEISELYKSIWDDNSIGSIKLYSDEIIKLITTNMNSGTWSTKEQAALCLSSLTDDIRNMIDTHLPMILNLIVQGLKGRTYPGKDSLLGSLSTLSTICSKTIIDSSNNNNNNNNNNSSSSNNGNNIPTPSEIVNIMFNECKKNDLEYKRKAITNLSIILKSFNTIDIYDKVIEEFYPFVFNQSTEESMNVDPKEEIDKDELKLRPMKALIRTQIYNVIGDSFKASTKETKLKNLSIADSLLNNLVSSLWSEQQSILYALSCFVKSIWSLDDCSESSNFYLDETNIIKLFSTIAETLNYTKYQAVKKSCLDLLEDIVVTGGKFKIINSNFDKIKFLITEASKKDNSIGVQVDKLLKLLN
ncbi:hypothetical protein DDB_G0288007 [Dictyostelium discoideum AX4]|uniref:Uncharacterized protein n=1 Tax=Dictyostelium discoideum TaxID=44689 RepID=Q54JJ7_DICDI|nr:hypothetical protein DDB_G0288007 [Dictyostelium discoideum AX4]EAL63429.1 hypothetical protein DDB_G0288007 [Dictyostelium discoideum AX4]|eukprot:XP_636934.1 hypothetical protein DDB_G0288007 [Dictyostelium discoideum AX4]